MRTLIAALVFLAFISEYPAYAEEYGPPPGAPSSLTICQMKAGEKVVIMRTEDLSTLTAFSDKHGVAIFPEVPDGYWAIVEGRIPEKWQKEEIPLLSGRNAAYNCFHTTGNS
jgi:hypothetical protein